MRDRLKTIFIGHGYSAMYRDKNQMLIVQRTSTGVGTAVYGQQAVEWRDSISDAAMFHKDEAAALCRAVYNA
jgi:hypothetical protein